MAAMVTGGFIPLTLRGTSCLTLMHVADCASFPHAREREGQTETETERQREIDQGAEDADTAFGVGCLMCVNVHCCLQGM